MIVEDEHFAYLSIQSGAQNALVGDRVAWQRAYEDSLRFDFATMLPYLPKHCRSVLDVGGGLGGIDVLLAKHYPGLSVSILDGVDDMPLVKSHSETFNNQRVAQDFLAKNGVEEVAFVGVTDAIWQQYDLIVSRRSWCFHYAPDVYAGLVRSVTRAGTPIIVDIRRAKPEWGETLRRHFDFVTTTHCDTKFAQQVYHAR